jgi:dihydrofolate synthase/folylpolyglutamate synthase
MGGDLDATNIIPEKCLEAAVITPIDFDHTEFLGKELHQIARSKAGIIKNGAPTVIARQSPEVLEVLRETAAARGSELIQARPTTDYPLGMLGDYQVENAALAVSVLEMLRDSGKREIPESAIRSGLQNARFPGRFEVFRGSDSPTIVADGSHNAQGGRTLAANLTRYFAEHLENAKIVFVVGVLKDKDIAGIVEPILPLAEWIYTVTPNNPRAIKAGELARRINFEPVESCRNIAEALESAKTRAGKDGVVCCFGSLYSVGAIRSLIAGKSK